MKVLILGATGQDGLILSSLLSEDSNFEVVPVHRPGSARALSSLLRVKSACIENYDVHSIRCLLGRHCPDVVVNLIGQSSVGQSFVDKAGTQYANFQIPKNVCSALQNFPSVFLVHASSAYIFDCSSPIGFRSNILALSPYAKSKASIYSYLKSIESMQDRMCILHLFNHVSEYSDRRFLLPKLATLFRSIEHEDHVPVVVDNVAVVRNWGLSKDYMRVAKKILELPASKRRREYFVGSNLNLSVLDLVEGMAACLHKSFSLTASGLSMRSHDPLRVEIDSSLLFNQGLEMPGYCAQDFIQRVLKMFSDPNCKGALRL